MSYEQVACFFICDCLSSYLILQHDNPMMQCLYWMLQKISLAGATRIFRKALNDSCESIYNLIDL